MKRIVSLDCTLRDGGYCNQWNFRENNIKTIISGLASAGVEIIECGFLTNRVTYDKNISKYTDLSQLNSYINKDNNETDYVVMVNIGEYDAESLPYASETVIDGIRVAFHRKDIKEALDFCKVVKKKGYKLFIQPMVTMLYTDNEFESLIDLSNELEPYAFYIVDSFGTMDEETLLHYYNIADENVCEKCAIGFHSHNNLQTAFSNCKSLVKNTINRKIIIDSSIYGMGRGAGNLNSELFLNELNNNYGGVYNLKPLLRIMDEVISRFYNEKPWGYSLPNYLSAIHMVHPNYAKYLTEKETLLLEDMDEIFSVMDSNKAVEYDSSYIEQLYIDYMSFGSKNEIHMSELLENVSGRKVLLIAPGASARQEADLINDFITKNNPIVIGVNHEYLGCNLDYIFISNTRRFSQLPKAVRMKTIATSNIKADDVYIRTDYKSLLNDEVGVRDNAGLMAIKFILDELNVKEIYLAGYDGYVKDSKLNYESEDLTFFMNEEMVEVMNSGMRKVIHYYREKLFIKFVTSSLLND